MVKGFSRAQISLHWAVALLIIYQIIFHEGMVSVWRGFRDTGTATMTASAWGHIIAGILVLALALWRLGLRFTRGVPAEPAGQTALMKAAAAIVHWGLYALMLAMPVTGLLVWYGGVTSLAGLHADVLKLVLLLLILFHIAAALYHQFALKDNLLERMRKPLD